MSLTRALVVILLSLMLFAAYCIYMQEKTLAGVALGGVVGYLQQPRGEKRSTDVAPQPEAKDGTR